MPLLMFPPRINYNLFVFLVTLLLILITSSCDDSTTVTTKDKIVDNWLWLQSTGGWTGGTITPDSVGYSIILSFEEDGIYSKFQNDSLVTHCGYTVERKEYSNREHDILIIEDHYAEQVIEYENTDKLKLIEICADCYEHTYEKIGHPLD